MVSLILSLPTLDLGVRGVFLSIFYSQRHRRFGCLHHHVVHDLSKAMKNNTVSNEMALFFIPFHVVSAAAQQGVPVSRVYLPFSLAKHFPLSALFFHPGGRDYFSTFYCNRSPNRAIINKTHFQQTRKKCCREKVYHHIRFLKGHSFQQGHPWERH